MVRLGRAGHLLLWLSDLLGLTLTVVPGSPGFEPRRLKGETKMEVALDASDRLVRLFSYR